MQAGRFLDEWEARVEFETRYVARHLRLDPDEAARVEAYRRMLLILEVPDTV